MKSTFKLSFGKKGSEGNVGIKGRPGYNSVIKGIVIYLYLAFQEDMLELLGNNVRVPSKWEGEMQFDEFIGKRPFILNAGMSFHPPWALASCSYSKLTCRNVVVIVWI